MAHKTTKNTLTKPRVTRLSEITLDVNGEFTLVTEISGKEFHKLYHEWFYHPSTKMWCAESLIIYIKIKHPNSICLLKEDFLEITKGKGVTSATKEEWEAENN